MNIRDKCPTSNTAPYHHSNSIKSHFHEIVCHSPVVMEVQRQYVDCFILCLDFSQTITSQEIKNTNLSVCTAGNNSEVDESQRFNLPAGLLAAFRMIRIKKCEKWQITTAVSGWQKRKKSLRKYI